MQGDFAPTQQMRVVAGELTTRIMAELERLQPVFSVELREIDAAARAMELPLVRIPDTAVDG